MSTAIKRLHEFSQWAKKNNLVKSEREFEHMCGLATSYIYNMSKNSSGSIGSDKIASVALKFPMLNVRWLCTGEGKMITDEDIPIEINKAILYINKVESILKKTYRR